MLYVTLPYKVSLGYCIAKQNVNANTFANYFWHNPQGRVSIIARRELKLQVGELISCELPPQKFQMSFLNDSLYRGRDTVPDPAPYKGYHPKARQDIRPSFIYGKFIRFIETL